MRHAFLLHDNRSGSTLLSSLLNTRQGVVVTQESGFMPFVLENFQDESALEVEKLLEVVYAEPQFREWNMDRDQLAQRLSALPGLTYRAVFDAILDEYLKVRGEEPPEVLVVKGPRFHYHLDRLAKIYPDPQIIFLVRDGRAVYNSKRDMVSVSGMKMSGNIFHAALDWKKKIALVAGQAAVIVRFEDLVTHPEEQMEKILDVLEVSPPGRETVRTQADFHKLIGKSQKHLHSNVQKAPDQNIAVKWKKNLSPAQVYVYERICRAELKRFGYELRAQDRPPAMGVVRLVVGSALHWCWQKARNLFYFTFIDRSLRRRLNSKRFE